MTDPEPRLNSVEAGTLLARCRAERQVSLEQAAQALHLPREILLRLEEGRVGAFDARIYYLGHLRRYAQWLGLAPDALVGRLADLPAWTPPLRPDPSEAENAPWGGVRTRWLPVALSGLSLLAAAGILIAYSGLSTGPTRSPAIPGKPAGHGTPRSPGSPPVQRGPGGPPPSPGAALRPPARPLLVLDFSFRHRSWIEVDRDGHVVYAGLVVHQKTLTLRVAPPVRIHIGNAPAVRLTVNGEPFALAPWTGPRRVAVFGLAGPVTGRRP